LDLTYFGIFESWLGNISLVSKGERLISLDISRAGPHEIKKALLARYPDGKEAVEPFKRITLQLDRYLKGNRIDFDVEVDISMERAFTRTVLLVVKKIPYGETMSYLQIARTLGYKNAARAVGQAVKRNPIPIVIPCHRVVREDRSIGGFSLGIDMKRKLLALEGLSF